MSKFIKILIAVVVVAVIIYAAFYLFNHKNVQAPSVVGGDKDERGCIGSAGYTWCQTNNKCLRVFEEFCPDTVSKLVGDIASATQITLQPKGETNFKWVESFVPKVSEKNITGVLYQAYDITRTNYEKIEKYFNDNGKRNINWEADGVDGGQRGYTINYLACLLNFSHNKMKNTPNTPSEPVGDSLKVELSCGFYNPNIPSN